MPEPPAVDRGVPELLGRSPGGDRRRLDLALSTARPRRDDSTRRGIPGLRKELFPAAAWRRELEALEVEEERRRRLRADREEAHVRFSLAAARAEDILQHARVQARRLVRTAAAVARTRREQAERAAAATLAEAERVAEETLAAAERQASSITEGPGIDAAGLNERLLRLRTALTEAEAKLGAFSESTRQALATGDAVIDLDAEQRRGERHAEPEPDPVYGPPVPRIRPKSRFMVAGLSPDRIEALRDELAP